MTNKIETLGHFLDSGDLWGDIQAVKDFPFFTEFTSIELNEFTDLIYGNRVLYRKFNTVDGISVTSAAQFLVMTFDKKWTALISINEADFDFTVDGTLKRKELINETESNNSDGETLNKVSAYNSEELVTDGGSTNSETGGREGETIRVIDTGKQSLSNAWDNLTALEKTTIVRTVTGDVAEFLTLSTY